MTAPAASQVASALQRLRAHVDKRGVQGCDPYDLLASTLPIERLGRRACFVLTQIHKRNPVDLRRWLGIAPALNPKALGLLLAAEVGLSRCEVAGLVPPGGAGGTASRLRSLARRLIDGATPTGSGIAWGLPFAYASRVEMIPAGAPSLVVTAFAHRGLRAYHRHTGDPEVVEVLRRCCKFVLDDLPRFETAEGLCFAYTGSNPVRYYNATMLAAEMLASTWSVTRDRALLEPARRTVDFVLARQHDDGHWAYSISPEGSEKQQIDFHQGYVLSSLLGYAEHADDRDPRIGAAIERGADYYRRVQFDSDGRSLWRVPRRLPTDIHNQAQGILTFAELSKLSDSHLRTAMRIARWTIQNMQSDEGYFYYRRGRWFTNRIDYLRWGQAWMMLALVTLLESSATTNAP
jgi:hypothetical protein